jgi:ribosomal protein S5
LGEGEIDIGDGIVIKGGSSSAEKSGASLESPTMLRDKEGRLWSGVVLDTDMVQKSMPGQRVGTHRALVVVGNMRGSAGYGMGKGKTSGDAVNAAFR